VEVGRSESAADGTMRSAALRLVAARGPHRSKAAV